MYGTIAEIGAGQEVSRCFFRAGGAAGTIAKTISANDVSFSNAIYGGEKDKRYILMQASGIFVRPVPAGNTLGVPSKTGGGIRRMVVRRSIEMRTASEAGVQHSKKIKVGLMFSVCIRQWL